MANNKNSGRLSPANWIAIIAMALLALFTFFGHLYSSDDGQMGVALLLTVLEVVLLASALVLAIKAKGAKSHFGMWRIVKYVALAVYVIVAIAFASPLLSYFHVMAEKSSLKATALEEIDAIQKLYDDYNDAMEAATDEATERLNNYFVHLERGEANSPSLDEYLKLTGTDKRNVEGFKETMEDMWTLEDDPELDEWREQLENWGIFDMNIAQVGASIEKKGEEVATAINALVKENADEHYIIPVIKEAPYSFAGYVDYTAETPDTGNFHEALTKGGTTSVLGWVMLVLLHLLILLNFAVAEGSGIQQAGSRSGKKGQDTGTGISL